VVGPDRVVAGADCGFATLAWIKTKVDSTIAWSKLWPPVQGARLASAA
jgi:5-methyltetrahydropteroyltriglutamate--homocysteine methyltransferase